MKAITIEGSVFVKQDQRRRIVENHDYHGQAPESMEVNYLKAFIAHHRDSGAPITFSQLDMLLSLLAIADGNGHNINRLLMMATAAGWRRVVFDNHLLPA